jgi:hypothetical protein
MKISQDKCKETIILFFSDFIQLNNKYTNLEKELILEDKNILDNYEIQKLKKKMILINKIIEGINEYIEYI